MQSAVHAHGPQKGAKRVVHVRPESGTKTDVVSRGALVKKYASVNLACSGKFISNLRFTVNLDSAVPPVQLLQPFLA